MLPSNYGGLAAPGQAKLPGLYFTMVKYDFLDFSSFFALITQFFHTSVFLFPNLALFLYNTAMTPDLFNLNVIEEILAKNGLKPAKRFGQNFMMDPLVVEGIVKAAKITKSDWVAEIGPGLGALTIALCQKAQKVVAIEKDRNMVAILKDTCADFSNLQIENKDALYFDWNTMPKGYKIVANIPFYITAPLVRSLLEAQNQPQMICLLMQKEVAYRIAAKQGDMTLLSVAVQFYANAEVVLDVSREVFYPEPKVDAAIIRIIPKNLEYDQEFIKNFFHLVKLGFSSPRKTLLNNLSSGLNMPKDKIGEWLSKNFISPQQRPESLSIDQWILLIKNFVD